MPDTPHVTKLTLHFTLIEYLHHSILRGNLKKYKEERECVRGSEYILHEILSNLHTLKFFNQLSLKMARNFPIPEEAQNWKTCNAIFSKEASKMYQSRQRMHIKKVCRIVKFLIDY